MYIFFCILIMEQINRKLGEREKIEVVPRVCQFYVSYLCKFRQKLKFISSDIQEIPLLIFSEVFSVVL